MPIPMPPTIGGPVFRLRYLGPVCPCLEKPEDEAAREALRGCTGLPVRYHRRGSDVFVVTRLLPGEQVRVQLSGPCSLEDISMDDYNSRLNGNGAPADAEGKPAAPANVTMEPSDGKEEMTDGVQSVTNSVVEEGYA